MLHSGFCSSFMFCLFRPACFLWDGLRYAKSCVAVRSLGVRGRRWLRHVRVWLSCERRCAGTKCGGGRGDDGRSRSHGDCGFQTTSHAITIAKLLYLSYPGDSCFASLYLLSPPPTFHYLLLSLLTDCFSCCMYRCHLYGVQSERTKTHTHLNRPEDAVPSNNRSIHRPSRLLLPLLLHSAPPTHNTCLTLCISSPFFASLYSGLFSLLSCYCSAR